MCCESVSKFSLSNGHLITFIGLLSLTHWSKKSFGIGNDPNQQLKIQGLYQLERFVGMLLEALALGLFVRMAQSVSKSLILRQIWFMFMLQFFGSSL